MIVTGGAGFQGRPELSAPGVKSENIFIPRAGLRLTDRARHRTPLLCFPAGQGRCGHPSRHAEVGGIANQKNPGRYFFANMAMAVNSSRKPVSTDCPNAAAVHPDPAPSALPKVRRHPFQRRRPVGGYPEETNAPYRSRQESRLADARRVQAPVRLPQRFILPVNLYGPHDNFDLQSSHVIPALIRKCIEAQQRRPGNRLLGHRQQPAAVPFMSTTQPKASAAPPTSWWTPTRSTWARALKSRSRIWSNSS